MFGCYCASVTFGGFWPPCWNLFWCTVAGSTDDIITGAICFETICFLLHDIVKIGNVDAGCNHDDALDTLDDLFSHPILELHCNLTVDTGSTTEAGHHIVTLENKSTMVK